jgi:hypothetical protein
VESSVYLYITSVYKNNIVYYEFSFTETEIKELFTGNMASKLKILGKVGEMDWHLMPWYTPLILT